MAEILDYKTLTHEEEVEVLRIFSNPAVVQYLSNEVWDALHASRSILLDNTKEGVVKRARAVGVLDTYQNLLLTIQEHEDTQDDK